MEKRAANVMFQASGGTASGSGRTCRLVLPTAWVRALGITEEDRQVELRFDGSAITISRRRSAAELLAAGKRLGHDLLYLRYFDGDTLCSVIAADRTARDLCVENFVADPQKTAFGNNRCPVWEDLQAFLRERCIPETRAGLREYLEALGLSEFDPLAIIRKTGGRMAEDAQHLEILAGEDLP